MVAEIRINSEQYHNIRISANQITEWLKTVSDVSGEDELGIALKICRLRVLTDEQITAVSMTRELIIHEADGNIIPPIGLYDAYHSVTEGSEFEIKDRRKGERRGQEALYAG